MDFKRPIERATLKIMADALCHRGPDAEGIWIDGPAGLIHRRLSIIDLSEAANQPMHNEDGSVWIVFNGEIYNFLEMRDELIAKGHRFVTRSDTEVLLHLYEEKGTEMLALLRGMFAFAIWDARRRRLFAARDRIGKKPFKYYLDGEKFLFASELKAIRARGDVKTDIEAGDIHQYLGFGYVFAPNTGFRQIKKLPPAHFLILENGRLRIERYWRLDYRRQTDLNFDECRERIIPELEEAVRLRLISDVPLGAFLSGGVDSSAVVALMARHSSQPVRTFSIGFDFDAHNELPYARAVARQYATNHTEHVVKADAASVLPELARLYEEPYTDSSALPSYYLAQVTRRSVTVALNGDGGDENFCGYERYHLFMKMRGLIKQINQFRLGWLLSLGARALPGSLFASVRRRAGAIHGLLNAPNEQIYGRLIYSMTDELKSGLYVPEFQKWIKDWPNHRFIAERFAPEYSGSLPLAQALLWDFENYLPEDLCAKMDIATMAHGLEARSPFLDHKFMEFCATIPIEWKYRNGDKKHILKQALTPLLPHDILYRRKQGFGIPIHEWFRGDLKPLVHDTLLAPGAGIHRWLDKAALARLAAAHESGASDEGYRLWLLLMLELWLRSLGSSS